jgi:ERCC4-type nuclease
MEDKAIRIIVDDRERGAVLAALEHSGRFAVEVQHLAVGDYQVDGRFLFERKTLPDLVRSIVSGRLFKQILQLAEVEGLRPVLILEGTSADIQESGMQWEAVRGALVTVALFLGVPVLRSRSPEETVATFLYAARQARTVALGALPRRGYRPKGKAALQRYILQGLPEVGPERAARLLANFGTVQAMMTADEDDLLTIDGIGKHTARRIMWAVKEVAPGYG